MTLVNAWVEPGRVLLAADTALDMRAEGYAARLDCTKIYALSHIGAALAGRGSFRFVAAVANAAGMSASFDVLVDGMPGVIEQLYEQLRARPAPMEPAQQIVVAGWSERAQRMQALAFTRDNTCKTETAEIGTTFIAPGWDGADPNMDLSTTAAMIAAARQQVAWGRKHHPDAALGGRLILATLTRRHAVVETIYDLDRDAPIAAPASMMVRGGGGALR